MIWRFRQGLEGFSSVQLPCHVWLFVTPWTAARQASLSSTNSWSLLKLMCTISSSVFPFSSHLQSFPASGSFPMSQFFTSGGQSIGAALNEYSGLISFRMDWLELLTVQGALKTLLQHCSSKAPILRRFRCVYSSIGQGTPRTARNYQKEGEKHGTCFRFQKDPTLGTPWF